VRNFAAAQARERRSRGSGYDLTILSLGAGVQSTTLALLAAHGVISPMPDYAVFADTQSEPAHVYRHLSWLMSPNVLPFPVHVVTVGSLRDQILSASAGRTRNDGRPPLYIRNDDDSCGTLRRQCTDDFKIIPIEKEIRRLLGLKPGQRWPRKPVVEEWIGISLDEFSRVKLSRREAIVKRHPLIELGMGRLDCLDWLHRHGYPLPGKSACTFCPYKKDSEWRDMKDNDPDSWRDACEIDEAVRSKQYVASIGEAYVHRSLRPLSEVDFSKVVNRENENPLINECDGVCGV
jgi:hypothetical protein